MIIIDMNQISLANVMMNFHMSKSDELEEDMVRHMILNSIRMYRMMFKEKYGEIVLTYDSRHYWRRDIFPQYKHEYNPVHTHSGNFSGVIYLKIPDDMENHFIEETKDHYPASGLIEFSHGEKQDFKSDTLMFKPRVGQMLVFPNWLKHSVYPFYCEGERRSMSFNAYWKI